MVDLGVEDRALHRLGVDVDGLGRAGAQLARGDGQDARTAAVVQQGRTLGQFGFQPGQAQVRGRMAAGAEGQARIEFDMDGAVLGLGRFQACLLYTSRCV